MILTADMLSRPLLFGFWLCCYYDDCSTKRTDTCRCAGEFELTIESSLRRDCARTCSPDNSTDQPAKLRFGNPIRAIAAALNAFSIAHNNLAPRCTDQSLALKRVKRLRDAR